MNIASFSFYNRSSPTGYSNWSLLINGVTVGSGTTTKNTSGTLGFTGVITIPANAASNLTGHVIVTLVLSSSTSASGTFRIDQFTLNGFVMQQPEIPGSSSGTDGSGRYRYGFNGKQKDNETYGEGNEYEYGFRIYNPRLGKFLSLDPLSAKYPWYTPYQFAGNKPINSIDLDGLEEYSSYDAYKMDKGDKALETMDGSDGAWLKSDRESKNLTWSNAMEAITKNIWKDKFKSFSIMPQSTTGVPAHVKEDYDFAIVRDFYNWCQHEVDQRGMNSEWAKGASYLVNGFVGEIAGAGLKASGVYNLMRDLNLNIAQYAVERFNNKFFGTGEKDGYEFDLDFIRVEQGPVAQKVYEQYAGSDALKTAKDLTWKEGFWSWIGGGMSPYLPNFKDFNVDITVSSTTGGNSNFGRGGRQHIPLLMLYTTKHAEYMRTTQNYICNSLQMTQVELANAFIRAYYETKMIYY